MNSQKNFNLKKKDTTKKSPNLNSTTKKRLTTNSNEIKKLKIKFKFLKRNTQIKLMKSRLITKNSWKKPNSNSLKNATNYKSSTATSSTSPRKTLKTSLPNLIKRKKNTKKKLNVKSVLKKKKSPKSSPLTKNSNKEIKSWPKSSIN